MNKVSYIIIVCVAALRLEARNIYPYPLNDDRIRAAADLYSKEMYRAALERLSREDENPSDNSLREDDGKFYVAMSALYAEQSNAEALLSEIIVSSPKNIHYSAAMFGYACYLYEKERYKDAFDRFREISDSELREADRNEYCFKAGYCAYKSGNVNEAVAYFRKIKEQRNRYADAATYYYSHIEYERGNYVTAKQGFERLQSNPAYASVVPYYTLQIAFLQKDYDRVIEDGENFLQRSVESRTGEITRLIAEAWLQKGNTKKASEYFERYEKSTTKITRDDLFLKAHIAYNDTNYPSAIRNFLSVANTERDSLAQVANYILGDCYLHIQSKSDALQSFKRASDDDFDSRIREDAFFNYAKLALEVRHDDEPMTRYFAKYPSAANTPEMTAFRADASAKKGNYLEGLRVLLALNRPTVAQKESIQRLAFAAGTEYLREKNYGKAIEMFDLSTKNSGFNNTVAALALYWKANALYSSGKYSQASSLFGTFINSPGAFNLPEFNTAHYNIGYCAFKERNYDRALQWFRKYVGFETSSSKKTVFLGDCYNRIGDCYFKKRNYQTAADNYSIAEGLGLSNPDYSALQKAITLGFTSGRDAKISALQRIPRSYPNSRIVPVAYYELGRTHQQQMNYDDAIASYQSVLKYSSSPVYPKALNEMGLIELNRGNSDKALSYYQQVVDKVPGSHEAQDAMEGIKNIYMEDNRMNEYFDFSRKVGQAIKNPGEKDSLVFVAAERIYQSGDCAKALPALRQYRDDYPSGVFLTAANFYLADCYMKDGNNSEALRGYSYVVRQRSNEFTESAWYGIARANFMLKNYTEAASAFEQVKALTNTPQAKIDAEYGCMRSYDALNNEKKAAASAAVLFASAGIDGEMKREAGLIVGRGRQTAGEYKEAVEIFKTLVKDLNRPLDAEAKYRLIASYAAMKKLQDADNEVMSFVDSQSRQQYWLAKSFIVLGDVYVLRKDKNQAKATYESVINGYPDKNDGVVEEAKQRLNKLMKQ